MDALQAAAEHLKDGLSGAQIMNADNIVLDINAAVFLLGLCEKNVKLTRTTGVGITTVHQYGGGTIQQEITDYVERCEIDYSAPEDTKV